MGEGMDGLGVWDGSVVKLGCDDGCTTINMIKFIELKKKKIPLPWLGSLWGAASIPGPLQWVKRIWHCHSCGIGCSCSSDSIPGLGTSIRHECGKRKKKGKEGKERKRKRREGKRKREKEKEREKEGKKVN